MKVVEDLAATHSALFDGRSVSVESLPPTIVGYNSAFRERLKKYLHEYVKIRSNVPYRAIP